MITIAAGRFEALWRLLRQGDPRRVVMVAASLFILGGILPAYLGLELTRGPRTGVSRAPASSVSLAGLRQAFDRSEFELSGAPGLATVPRLFAETLPHDWAALRDPAERKLMFTKLILPLVLRANEALAEQRARILDISAKLGAGKRLSAKDELWLRSLAAGYGVQASEVSKKVLISLARQVDVVPPSLAIAQAAIESGWGTSRFVAEGNALYGQWAEEGDHAMVPANRDEGRTYAIKSFASLQDSVQAYMRNLNTHRAYRKFRRARASMRAAGQGVSGLALAKHLSAYSQRGVRYVRDLTSIIELNELGALDGASFQSQSARG